MVIWSTIPTPRSHKCCLLHLRVDGHARCPAADVGAVHSQRSTAISLSSHTRLRSSPLSLCNCPRRSVQSPMPLLICHSSAFTQSYSNYLHAVCYTCAIPLCSHFQTHSLSATPTLSTAPVVRPLHILPMTRSVYSICSNLVPTTNHHQLLMQCSIPCRYLPSLLHPSPSRLASLSA